MKNSHFITATLIFSTLTLSSVDAAKRTMPSRPSVEKTSSAKPAKSKATKSVSKAVKTSTSKKKASASSQSQTTARQSSVQKAADKQVSELTSTQQSKLLNLLNEGSGKELHAINGIAKTRSEAIVKARPYKEIGEVILVKGIGKTTFASILDHAKNLPRKKSTSQKSSGSKSKSKKMAAS